MRLDDLQPNLLVQTPLNEVLKVSTLLDGGATAQVLFPVPPRTTVRTYSEADIANWREPSAAMIKRYEKAWGFDAPTPHLDDIVVQVQREAALADAQDLLAQALDGPAGEDDASVAPLRRIIAALS